MKECKFHEGEWCEEEAEEEKEGGRNAQDRI
jgi:hypothetical protein